jgi:hypothetical protein
MVVVPGIRRDLHKGLSVIAQHAQHGRVGFFPPYQERQTRLSDLFLCVKWYGKPGWIWYLGRPGDSPTSQEGPWTRVWYHGGKD